MRIQNQYAQTTYTAEDLENAKLKLKNECPKVLSAFVDKLQNAKNNSFRKVLGFKDKAPLAIAALADLRSDKSVASLNMEPYAAAKSFIAEQLSKEAQALKQPFAPRPTLSSSVRSTSSTSSMSSQRSVSFSDTDHMAIFDTQLAPRFIYGFKTK